MAPEPRGARSRSRPDLHRPVSRALARTRAGRLLDRLINNSHQVFMNGPSYGPNKKPGQRVTTTAKEPARRTGQGQDLVNYVSSTPAQ